jgi:hypothetical protein
MISLDINISNKKQILLFNKLESWIEKNNIQDIINDNNFKNKLKLLSFNEKLIVKKLLELYKIKQNYIIKNNNYLNEIYENIKKESIIIYPNDVKQQNKYKMKNIYLLNEILNISNKNSEYIKQIIKDKAKIKYASMSKEYHRLLKIKKRNILISRIGYKAYLKKQRDVQLRWYNKLSIERKNIMKEKKRKYWKLLILKRKNEYNIN